MLVSTCATALLMLAGPMQPADVRPDSTRVAADPASGSSPAEAVLVDPVLQSRAAGTAAEPSLVPAVDPRPAQEIVVTARVHASALDPLAAVNLQSFEATQAVDRAILRPAAMAFEHILPEPVRDGLRNFFYNLHEPDVFLNFLLQHKIGKAAETFMRFAVNSTIGVAGLFDIAKRGGFRLPRRPNGFADTFGFYGVRTGAYLFLPLIGPTTPRDLIGGLMDRMLLPMTAGAPFSQPTFSMPVGVLTTLDHRAEFDATLTSLHEGPANAYLASRAFYLQRRAAEIDHLRGVPPKPVEPGHIATLLETAPPR